MLQLVGSRLLAPHVGQSLEVWTSLIVVTLAGLALGSHPAVGLLGSHSRARDLRELLLVAALAATGAWTVVRFLPSTARAFKSRGA